MKRAILLSIALCMFIPSVISAATISIRGIDLDFVTIGNPSNPGDFRDDAYPSGSGSVDYTYRIGKYEVTNNQWDTFVSLSGAPRGNISDAYRWNSNSIGDNVPSTHISWYEAAQFCNYLTSGDKSKGAYLWSGDDNNPGSFLGINRDLAVLTYGNTYVVPSAILFCLISEQATPCWHQTPTSASGQFFWVA